jgi:hypothetical protein
MMLGVTSDAMVDSLIMHLAMRQFIQLLKSLNILIKGGKAMFVKLKIKN